MYVPPQLCEGGKANLEMQIMKEGKCKSYGKQWDSKHKCIKGKDTKNLYTSQATNDLYSEE